MEIKSLPSWALNHCRKRPFRKADPEYANRYYSLPPDTAKSLCERLNSPGRNVGGECRRLTTRETELSRPILTMKKLLILFVSFAFFSTAKANLKVDQIIEGLPVKVISSARSYKVFEQYPWEGHSSNYGPKGNRLNSGYGVGVGKNISRTLQVRQGDWIHMPDIGWRQINESSSKEDGIEFFATHRDEYKGEHPRIAIDRVVFALPWQRTAQPPY